MENKDNESLAGELNVEQIINFDDIKPNSLILIKIDKSMDPISIRNMIAGVEMLRKKYYQQITNKNISFFIVDNTIKLEEMKESSMNAAGWYKKGKIITLS